MSKAAKRGAASLLLAVIGLVIAAMPAFAGIGTSPTYFPK